MLHMVPEEATDKVYISGQLRHKYPAVAEALGSILAGALDEIPGTNDIWCRDYMPVQLAADRFVQFIYQPDYLDDAPELITADAGALLNLKNCVRSNFVIDGGNVVSGPNAAALTDKIFTENARVEASVLTDRLRALLEVERLFFVPQEPGDVIGHADGMVRFVDAGTVLVNEYRGADKGFGQEVAAALRPLDVIPFPYHPTYQRIDGVDVATGVYINFLRTKNIILVPAFGLRQDDMACRMLESVFPDTRVVPVHCRDVAHKGGAINCITWNILAGNST
jgi:agmatine deiminase